jgi:N-acetylglucosaminyldiphosphoundecaprenol N-acetyl-beta-D-mannosaminyltransferase
MDIARVDFMGLPLDPLTMDQSVDRCLELALDDRQHQHVVLNASKVNLARDDEQLRHIICDADIVNADGQSVVWAAGFLGTPVPERVAGIDLMHRLLECAALDGIPVYFLGATSEVLDEATRRLTDLYRGLQIAGAHDGYFEDGDTVATQVRASGARILFVAMPSPQKEFFVRDHAMALGPLLAFGVGGSLDVVAGHVRRAPGWMQRSGLEWLYRFAQEPARMWRRYLVGNTRFVWSVLAARVNASAH